MRTTVTIDPDFVVKAQDIGLAPGLDLANIHDLETELDVDAYLDITRKLEERQAIAKAAKGRS
jgi:hypothetical protein